MAQVFFLASLDRAITRQSELLTFGFCALAALGRQHGRSGVRLRFEQPGRADQCA